jgi:uncharacterized protein YciI
MPHFIIHCLDTPEAQQRRLEHYEEHKAYLTSAPIRILVSGPLVSDDGETMIGSLFLVEADSRAAVEAFNAADPFRRAGVWANINIHRFNKRVDERD